MATYRPSAAAVAGAPIAAEKSSRRKSDARRGVGAWVGSGRGFMCDLHGPSHPSMVKVYEGPPLDRVSSSDRVDLAESRRSGILSLRVPWAHSGSWRRLRAGSE